MKLSPSAITGATVLLVAIIGGAAGGALALGSPDDVPAPAPIVQLEQAATEATTPTAEPDPVASAEPSASSIAEPAPEPAAEPAPVDNGTMTTPISAPSEADRAKAEADRAKAEADRATTQADRAEAAAPKPAATQAPTAPVVTPEPSATPAPEVRRPDPPKPVPVRENPAAPGPVQTAQPTPEHEQ